MKQVLMSSIGCTISPYAFRHTVIYPVNLRDLSKDEFEDDDQLDNLHTDVRTYRIIHDSLNFTIDGAVVSEHDEDEYEESEHSEDEGECDESKVTEVESFEIFTSTMKKGDSNHCSICLSDVTEGHKYTELDCTHTFHEACLSKWLEYKLICPVCRIDVRHKTYSN